ncbi:hypothetical protein GY45DRAFT_778041 [Cubamyces sp. BRFM 1775]|nr:hypothetical protein GY45DRAFT_778041 [Cubamyces sp. BRFM 1775]
MEMTGGKGRSTSSDAFCTASHPRLLSVCRTSRTRTRAERDALAFAGAAGGRGKGRESTRRGKEDEEEDEDEEREERGWETEILTDLDRAGCYPLCPFTLFLPHDLSLLHPLCCPSHPLPLSHTHSHFHLQRV